MALAKALRQQLDTYCRADLDGDLEAHIAFFDFLKCDIALQERIGEEYFSARYIYKLMEGLRVQDSWAERAQIQLQVQQYASIYEACIHHLLFSRCSKHAAVQRLLSKPVKKKWTIRTDLQEDIGRILERAPSQGRRLIVAFESREKVDARMVRFDSKARVAATIGIVDRPLHDKLIAFYAARNLIHIHAEIRSGATWTWQLDFAKDAYRCLEMFREQVIRWDTP